MTISQFHTGLESVMTIEDAVLDVVIIEVITDLLTGAKEEGPEIKMKDHYQRCTLSLLIFPFPISGTRPRPFLKSSQNSRREICSRQFALGKSGKKIIFSRPAPFSRKSEIKENRKF